MDIRRIITGAAEKTAADKSRAVVPATKGQTPGPKKAAAPSLISADLRISGDLVSTGDIHVEGIVEGDIRSAMLTIGEGAEVRGAIVAEAVRVCGAVFGQIQAHRVELTRTAKVTGDILHELLSIESGAFIEGHCRRVEPARDGVVNLADAVSNPLGKKGGAA
ncbi:MAG: polymer-forming cytoskeletal protein [Alphaproteobacteria bacterium]|nr:polymer-forming cytoskeletal protein [Alphaproteobacteria bacterium]